MRKLAVVIAVLVAFACGFYLGSQHGGDRGALDMALVHELATLNLCVATLSLNEEPEGRSRALSLVRGNLNMAFDESRRLYSQGARIRQASPNLVETVRLAANHYESLGDDVRYKAALSLHDELLGEVH